MSQAGVIDSLQFARAGSERRGSLGIELLPRLSRMHVSTEGLEYRVCGNGSGGGKPSLRVSVKGSLQMPCQRCLEPLSISIALEVELQLAESMSEISEADDDVDRVLASRRMNVAELVEDEVILALPMVPRHDACVWARIGDTS